MTLSSRRRRANRRTSDLYQSRPNKRFAGGGLGPWLLVALIVTVLFGIVLVTH